MITTEPIASTDLKTLAQRMGEGRLPVAEALRYAMLLADSLRKIHDSGKVHGAVTPLNLAMTGGGVELLPAPEGSLGAVTPYTAPEVLNGRPPDNRSDIFSFGAILFEMLTGRRAFEGEGRTALTNTITNAPTPSSGSPAVDVLVAGCLAKNPDARSPRMQRVMMELRLVSVTARRADPATAAGARPESMDSEALRAEMQQPLRAEMQQLLRAEMQQLERRIAARLQDHEKAVTEIQSSAAASVSAVKGQIALLNTELAAAQVRIAASCEAGLSDAAVERILARVERGFEALSENVKQLDSRVEEIGVQHTHFERSVAADLVDIEQRQKLQGVAVESARTAMAQTDDLVERVVEALESLQTAVLDRGEPGAERAPFAVN